MRRHTRSGIAAISQRFLATHQVERSAYFYDLALLDERLDHLAAVFPSRTLHAVAIKCQSSSEVLAAIVARGHGLEASSFEEVELAIEAGCPAEKIVFDSPVKTRDEIARCCAEMPGLLVNVNSLSELARIPADAPLQIGIRINPKIVTGAPALYDVSDEHSKFGVAIERSDDVVEAALEHPGVSGLHMHIGSEIGNWSSIVTAVGRVLAIAEQIRRRGKKLRFIDIGGGLAVSQEPGVQIGLEEFYLALRTEHPGIDNYDLVTEYGRFVHAHNAFVLSRVEYVLRDRQPPAFLLHVGADLFVREVYSTAPPHHELFLLNTEGQLRTGKSQPVTVWGPLCFAGDRFNGVQHMALGREGDWMVISDCGANTLSLWSHHCSRTPPDWVSYRSGAELKFVSHRPLQVRPLV